MVGGGRVSRGSDENAPETPKGGPDGTRERVAIEGIPVFHGVVVGPACLVGRSALRVPRRRIEAESVADEVARLREAIQASRADIEAARTALGDEGDADYRLILEAHLLMHGDELVVDATAQRIAEDLICAEWALRRTIRSLAQQLDGASSEYFRGRAADITQVGLHILRCLTGTPAELPEADGPHVVVADDLSPAEVARLAQRPMIGLVTELGSSTSHTAIIARALGVPALVGVADATDRVGEGDLVVVDAIRGELILGADAEERKRAVERSSSYRAFTDQLESRAGGQVETTDGVVITLSANLELATEAAAAAGPEASGVGLFRTEFLCLDRDIAPTEDEQYAVYARVLGLMGARPVTFRAFDLGADKLPRSRRLVGGPNPALGLRGVRLLRDYPELFRAQVRAILRAALAGSARLMFPFVGSVADMVRARALVDDVVRELEAGGVPHGRLPVGAMIELPAAAMMAGALAERCDFFSVGTNDLVQYTLALDRTNPRVSPFARSLDPAVLKLLDIVARAAEAHATDLSMCGDMAADAFALPVVIGLGFRNLSMPTAAIPMANAVIERVDERFAAAVAKQALGLPGAEEVHDLVRESFADLLGDLWRAQGIG